MSCPPWSFSLEYDFLPREKVRISEHLFYKYISILLFIYHLLYKYSSSHLILLITHFIEVETGAWRGEEIIIIIAAIYFVAVMDKILC